MTQPDELSSMDLVTDVTDRRRGAELDRGRAGGRRGGAAAGVSVRELTDLAELRRGGRPLSTIWGRAGRTLRSRSSCCARSPRPATTSAAPSTAAGWSAPASASSTRRPRTRCTATSPGCPGGGRAAASASRSSCTSGPGRCCAGSRRSPGPSTRWSAATPTSTWSSWRPQPVEYLPNFYGPMLDGINGDDDTDRLLVRWRLRDPAVVAACAGRPPAVVADELAAGAVVALGVGADGGPGGRPARRRDRRWSPYPATSRRCGRRPGARPALAGRGARGARRALVADGAPDRRLRPRRLVRRRRRETDEARPESSCGGSRCRWSRRSAPRSAPRRPRRPAAARGDGRGRGLGRVRRHGRPALLLGVRRRGGRRAAALPGPGARRPPGRWTRTRSRPCWRRSRATGWPRPRWRWRCSTPSCAPQGRSLRARARRGPRPGAVRGLGRDHGQHPRAARRRRRLPRRGLRPDQAEDRARLGRRAGARRARAVRRRRAAAGRREHGVHPGRRAAPGQAGPVRPAADRAAAGRGGRARPRRPGEADPTPICLDESIVSARSAAAAIRLGACAIVNIKPGRVGGYLEARRIHDVCAAHGMPVWCGGMLETGLGRAANVALAALPGFTLPGDTSASGRYYRDRHHRAVRARRRPPAGADRPRARCRRRWPTGSPRSPPRPSGSPL